MYVDEDILNRLWFLVMFSLSFSVVILLSTVACFGSWQDVIKKYVKNIPRQVSLLFSLTYISKHSLGGLVLPCLSSYKEVWYIFWTQLCININNLVNVIKKKWYSSSSSLSSISVFLYVSFKAEANM